MSFQSFYIMRKVNALFLIIFFEATLTIFHVVSLTLYYTKKLMLYFLLFSLKHNNFFDIVLVIHLNQYLWDVFLSDISFSFLFFFWQFSNLIFGIFSWNVFISDIMLSSFFYVLYLWYLTFAIYLLIFIYFSIFPLLNQ